MQKILFALSIVLCAYAATAQVKYTVKEANINKYRGFAGLDLSSHLGGGTGLGFNVGARSQYRLPVLPITIRGFARWEVFGVGKTD